MRRDRNAVTGLNIDYGGQPVEVAMLQRLIQGLATDDNADRQAANPYAKYAEDFVAFGEERLEESYTEGVKRMMRSVVENRVTVVRSANSTGKTHAAARVAIAYYKAYHDSQVYLAAAPPEDNLKMLLWGQIESLVTNKPTIFSEDSVSLPGMIIKDRENKLHYIVGVTIPQSADKNKIKARFGGKHAPHILFIIDEGDAVPPEIYEAIESCMSGGHARLLIMFNPRSRKGPVYLMEKEDRANIVELSALEHPNVLTGEDIYPGAVTQEATLRRLNQWSRPLAKDEEPDAECFKVPDELVGLIGYSETGKPFPPMSEGYRRVIDPTCDYMVLARYPAISEDQLISDMDIEMANNRYMAYTAINGDSPPLGIRPIIGVDVAEWGKDRSVIAIRWGGYVAPFLTWSKIDTDETAIRALRVHKAVEAQYSNIDSTGVGASVAPYMVRHGAKANRIMVGSAPDMSIMSEEVRERGNFFSVRDQMLWFLREWLRTDPTAMLPPDQDLRDSLLAVSIEKGPRGTVKMTSTDTMRERLGGRSPDTMMALALTFAPPPKQSDRKLSVSRYMGRITKVSAVGPPGSRIQRRKVRVYTKLPSERHDGPKVT